MAENDAQEVQQLGLIMKQDRPRQLDLFWKIKGKAQGPMKTGSDYKGYEGYCRILSIQWGVHAPMDRTSGMSSGHRFMEPMVVHKRIDESSPLLMNAMCTNEVIDEAEFVYVDVPGTKTQVTKPTKIFTVKGFDGRIGRITAGTTADGFLAERVEVWFNKMSWRHEIASTEASDDRREGMA